MEATHDGRLFGLMKQSFKLACMAESRDHFVEARSELSHLIGAVCRRDAEIEVARRDAPRRIGQIFNRARELPDEDGGDERRGQQDSQRVNERTCRLQI